MLKARNAEETLLQAMDMSKRGWTALDAGRYLGRTNYQADSYGRGVLSRLAKKGLVSKQRRGRFTFYDFQSYPPEGIQLNLECTMADPKQTFDDAVDKMDRHRERDYERAAGIDETTDDDDEWEDVPSQFVDQGPDEEE